MQERFFIPSSLDFVSIPRTLVEDSSVSPQARFLYITIMSLGSGCSKSDVMLALGVSDYKYRNMVRELVDSGYLDRTQRRGACGTFEKVVFELSVPKPKKVTANVFRETVMEHENHRSEPHVKNCRAVDGFSENPSSEPHSKICDTVDENLQNPRSEPHSKICGAAQTKLNRKYGKYLDIDSEAKRNERYVFENITDDEYEVLFRLVSQASGGKRFERHQRMLCKPLADTMCSCVGDGSATFESVVSSVRSMSSDGRHRSKLPSYWFSDYSDEVVSSAKSISRETASEGEYMAVGDGGFEIRFESMAR